MWADPAPRRGAPRRQEGRPKLLRAAGFANVEIVSGRRPAVIATTPPPGAPIVLLYAHHDVQPEAMPHNGFTDRPTEQGGRLYGRGAADDKAGIAATHLAAFPRGGNPPVGVTVFVEGGGGSVRRR